MKVTVERQAGVGVNGGAELTGTYCAQRGQKRFEIRALAMMALPTDATPESLFGWTMRTLLSVYAVLAQQRANGVDWLASMDAAAVRFAALEMANIHIYRALQFAVTFAIT